MLYGHSSSIPDHHSSFFLIMSIWQRQKIIFKRSKASLTSDFLLLDWLQKKKKIVRLCLAEKGKRYESMFPRVKLLKHNNEGMEDYNIWL